jgi:hypothetical protein
MMVAELGSLISFASSGSNQPGKYLDVDILEQNQITPKPKRMNCYHDATKTITHDSVSYILLPFCLIIATVIVSGSGSSTDSALDVLAPSDNVPEDLPPTVNRGENVCEGKKPDLPNVDCIVDALTNVGPQA